VKLSLFRSMKLTIFVSGAERLRATSNASAGLVRTPTWPSTLTPLADSASRKRSAAAFAGRRAM
jgi:hypothetical protein